MSILNGSTVDRIVGVVVVHGTGHEFKTRLFFYIFFLFRSFSSFFCLVSSLKINISLDYGYG